MKKEAFKEVGLVEKVEEAERDMKVKKFKALHQDLVEDLEAVVLALNHQ